MPDYSVYVITNLTNGKRYVGQTVLPLTVRWRRHKSYARKEGKLRLSSAIRSYGEDSFDISLLAKAVSRSHLDELEIFWIRKLRTRDPRFGYNLASGGNGGSPRLGHTNSREHNKKIGLANKGRVFSDLHRKKLSEAKRRNPVRYWLGKGKPKPEKKPLMTQNGVRTSWNKGKHLSEKHRRKLSIAHLRNPTRYWLGKGDLYRERRKACASNRTALCEQE